MNSNRKILLYGSVAAAGLVVVIAIFLIRLFPPSESGVTEFDSGSNVLYRAVPSDAVLILDLKEVENFKSLVGDTVSFAYELLDRDHLLNDFQRAVSDIQGAETLPILHSLHYSSKNDVSVFCAIDITSLLSKNDNRDFLSPFLQDRAKRYNETDIYRYKDALYLACHENIVMASSSLYILESSIRHLYNNTSILDNAEFKLLQQQSGNKKCLYINHHQIGKLFSGVMTRAYLKYSDFFLRFASWSALEVNLKDGELELCGSMENGNEQKYNSSVLYSQLPAKSCMSEILPHETVYALSLSLADAKGYLDAYSQFLEVHKKLSGYKEGINAVAVEGKKPVSYLCDSLEIEEIVAAYCKFGDRYEWLTFIKERSSFGFSDVVGSVIEGDKEVEVKPYIYKGYIKSVFGEAFSHCKEEAWCKIDNWQVIGPESIVKEYVSGNANYTSLDYYLKQTPVEKFFDKEGIVKILVNPYMGKDSVLQVLKPYYANQVRRSMDYKNFEFVAVNVTRSDQKIVSDVGIYAVKMKQLPMERPREELVMEVYVDSTIVVDNSRFELKDFTTGGKCYLEQLPNNKLRMLNGKNKGLWTIPFEKPLCGAVAQVDFFKNGKLQMLFVSDGKLYMLDRLGRIVRGFPLSLPEKVVYGPHVMDMDGDRNYSFSVLNEDNSVSVYKLNREKIDEGILLKAPEFIKELPVEREINGKKYLLLKTVQRLRIYSANGKEIVVNDRKRAISPDSGIEELAGGEIKVTGVDGDNFIVDLATGKTKKIK